MTNHVISIFGSSRPVEGDPDYRQAYEIGRMLGAAGFVVCNGGYGGTMAASARGAVDAGGSTIGVTSGFFPRSANPWINKEVRVESFTDRLMKLIELGDAYVILKGGTGTLLELAAVWEMINKRVMREKPIVVVGDFWKGVVDTLREELIWEGLGDCTRYVRSAETAQECVDLITKHYSSPAR